MFGPGESATGAAVVLCVEAGYLGIEGRAEPLPVQGMKLERAGFDEAGLAFSWSDRQGHWVLQVLDRADAARILSTLPAPLRESLGVLRRQTQRRKLWRGLGWGGLIAALLAPLLALGLFFAFSDELAGFAARRIPVEQERRLGQAGLSRMLSQARLRDDGESARVVRQIGARLTRGSVYRYEFHVVEDPAVNAYALPGGFIVVHSGLIATTRRPEELAAVLAHEVQHVELRHSLKSLIKQFGLSALWSLAAGDAGASVVGEAAQRMLGLRFSREAEREADERGVAALLRAGIDPSGMVAFFGRLAAHGDKVPDFLSTHPSFADRQVLLAALVRSMPATSYQALAFAPWPPRD